MSSTSLRKKSFSLQTTSSFLASPGSPMMGVITSVGIRCFSPSSSMSTSALAGASGLPLKSPTNCNVSTFNDACFSQAASPILDNPETPIVDHVTFLSAAHGTTVIPELLERSLSFSNLLGVAFGSSKQSSASPLGFNEEGDIVATTNLPIYTVVANVDANDELHGTNVFGCTQGPLADSRDPTPSGNVTSSAVHVIDIALTTNRVAHDPSLFSPSEAAASDTSTTMAFQNAPHIENIVLRLTEEDQTSFSAQIASNTNLRSMDGQPESSINTAPNVVSPLLNEDPIISSVPMADTNLGLSGLDKTNAFPLFIDTHQTTSIVTTLAAATQRPPQPPVTLREATPEDAEGIIALRDSLDMTNATSFVWELEDMRRRIATRYPLVLVALSPDPREDSPTKGADMVVGVSGIDVHGMEKDFPITAIGSRLLGVPAGTEYTFPSEYCMCRGLLIHPLFQGAGLGSKLHKGRLKLLAEVMPDASVILSARGSTLEETLSVITPHIEDPSDVTPVFTKDELFEFTFHTSQGIVHMVHGKDDGWKFVGVDIADGGPVWLTSQPLSEIVSAYDIKVEKASQRA